MSARTPRYEFYDRDFKKKKTGFGKKAVLQSSASVVILAATFLALRYDMPYSKYFKDYVKRSLSVSSDVQSVKKIASYAIKKSGLDNIDAIKNFDKSLAGDETDIQNAEADVLAAPDEVTDEITDGADTAVKESEKKEFTAQSNAVPAFRNPTEGKISSVFGERIHPVTGESGNIHTGIDIAGVYNQTVISAAEGRVIKTAEDNANGKYIIIEHTGGYTTAYAHLNKICVAEGEIVDNNTKIGEMGESGIATGVHLHFEIKRNGERLNPEEYVLYKHK